MVLPDVRRFAQSCTKKLSDRRSGREELGRARAWNATRKATCLSYDLGGSLFLTRGAKRSIGTGKNVVVLRSLEISRIVWRKRSWSAIGSLLIIAAACTIFSAA